ncbi:hypothetical protein [Paenibacillus harenae]|uniref:Uncharacterized protein n=1 Tax=Paenibacillus harenae TaxID=306543 RepID=A0ABT9TZA6_PAEHA|nr:hypothetical protein [Paenibacillus harenae]MDQ0059222.1 hypothetical protein [Paenibacillus harenae]MDQ0112686.1 hypothetical protein [Paenibacillus harenae]
MKNSSLKQRVVWFINAETEKVLSNLRNGAVNRDHALGSLHTLYQAASSTRDADMMGNLCRLIHRIRETDQRLGVYHFAERKSEPI